MKVVLVTGQSNTTRHILQTEEWSRDHKNSEEASPY